MEQQHMRWPKRVTALVGAVTLGILGLATPAAAQQNLDPNETGSITVHKFEEPETATGLANDGTLLDDTETAALSPLEGVQFTVQQVGDYDLTTTGGWDAIEGMTPAQAADENLVEVGSDTTGPDGQASFAGLDLGLYLVTETGHGDNLIPNSAAPFLVTVPMPHAEQGWLYDVHAYPKNSVTSIEKTLDDSDAYGLGDTITWTVTADVPQLPEGETFTEFAMTDELVEALEFQEVRVMLGGTAVPADAYTITTPTEGSNALAVNFTDPAGLDYLGENEGETVTFEIDTAVTSIGTITNVANIAINGWDSDTDPFEGSAWGALDIFKHNGNDEALSGAEFQIFTSAVDAGNRENAVTVNGSSTFTSETRGIASVAGLRAGTYWVVETEAPDGYIGVEDSLPPITIVAGENDTLNVQNDQRGAFELPLTGGIGTAVFVLVGLAVVALAVGLGVRHQRAKRAA